MQFKINSYKRNCNRNKNKNQFSFLFNSFTKRDWIEELTNVDSNIYYFIKEEVEEFFYNTGGYLILYLDFDSVYKLAVEMTKSQVEKSIRKNKKCFFEIKENNNLLIYKIIKERLLNNLKNLFDEKRKVNVLNIDLWIMDSVYVNYEYEIATTLWDLRKLANSNPQIIIDNIIKLANSFEITLSEIDELGEKLNIDFFSAIPELNLSLEFRNSRKDANNQAFFVFEIEDFGEVA